MRFKKKYLSLHAAIALFVCLVVILALSVTGILIAREIASQTEKNLSDKAMNIARMVAHSPMIIEALEGKREEAEIQSLASKIQHMTNVQYIVVMDMNHIRNSHPDPTKIGKHFVGGDEAGAMNGKEYISIAEGTLGRSLRAFKPIRNTEGKQIGVVAVGILLNNVQEAITKSTRIVYIGIGFGILIGIFGALALARKIKNILFGLEPFQIANLFQERNAMLESVREGILAVNQESKIILANTEAVRMFQRAGIYDHPIGKHVEDYLPNSRLSRVLEKGTPEYDQEHDLNGMTLVVNRVPVIVQNKVVGALATFRDKTELKQLAEQLTGVKLYAEALRVKTHEFMNKLHVILGMVHIGDYEKLSSYIRQITNKYQMEIGSVSRLVKDPVLAGFLLSKLSYAREHGVNLHISGECSLPSPKHPEIVDELITIFGNLIDNGIEAVENRKKKEINISLGYDGKVFSLSVKDSGGGIPEELREKIFEKGFSTKGENRGYGLFLVRQSVERLAGTLTLISDPKWTIFTVELPYEDEDEKQ
ncbi:DcuS/MalK family sensor histidine kinase [Paenactinomyces guangxiensis]|uniref:histidine kinase n=1 Tax=Paenactinomyces guangxiensis TaxID=1490290 RepID=A0A7W1WN94_9BACL|nr:DcuS/MalK family sensor histidine kinase [Paenactinomyces guangxiensis]MBA4493014.1 two-component system sensor histidine kinase DcuS [Paenactinomyces guangxiensis]MBH8590137.1 two-component system sensor histidine kinase DcuS [Paenactinomyces guangxiensis]